MVLRTEWLVCRAFNPAASVIDFMKEPSEFSASGCFLYQIMEEGPVMAARKKREREPSLFFSGGRLARYSRKNFTGQRGPAAAYIFGLKLWSGTNWFSSVRVVLPRSENHSTYSTSGPVFSFNLEVAELHSVVLITSPPAKEHGVVEPDGTLKTLGGWSPNCFAVRNC